MYSGFEVWRRWGDVEAGESQEFEKKTFSIWRKYFQKLVFFMQNVLRDLFLQSVYFVKSFILFLWYFQICLLKGARFLIRETKEWMFYGKKIIFQKITLMVLDKFFWKISIILETKIDSNFFISTNWVNFIYYMKCLSFNKTVSFKRRKYKPYIPYIIS